MNKNDALGNPIIIGNIYGYSSSRNGISMVTTGEVLNFTPKGYITLKPLTCVSAAYNDEPKNINLSKLVTVKPIHLFPIH